MVVNEQLRISIEHSSMRVLGDLVKVLRATSTEDSVTITANHDEGFVELSAEDTALDAAQVRIRLEAGSFYQRLDDCSGILIFGGVPLAPISSFVSSHYIGRRGLQSPTTLILGETLVLQKVDPLGGRQFSIRRPIGDPHPHRTIDDHKWCRRMAVTIPPGSPLAQHVLDQPREQDIILSTDHHKLRVTVISRNDVARANSEIERSQMTLLPQVANSVLRVGAGGAKVAVTEEHGILLAISDIYLKPILHCAAVLKQVVHLTIRDRTGIDDVELLMGSNALDESSNFYSEKVGRYVPWRRASPAEWQLIARLRPYEPIQFESKTFPFVIAPDRIGDSDSGQEDQQLLIGEQSPPSSTAELSREITQLPLPPTAKVIPPTAKVIPPTAKVIPPTAKVIPPTAKVLPPTAKVEDDLEECPISVSDREDDTLRMNDNVNDDVFADMGALQALIQQCRGRMMEPGSQLYLDSDDEREEELRRQTERRRVERATLVRGQDWRYADYFFE